MRITISKENYLKAIAEAQSEGEPVISATLARWLGVSPPAVTMAIKRLKRDGLIAVGKNVRIALTASGRDIAGRILHRHHLIERMLNEIFGMEWYKVHDEAEQLEHAVSEDFEKRLLAKLGRGRPCPHGNSAEIDTPKDRRKRGWRTLNEAPTPSRAVVVSVYERDRKLLEYLDRLSIQPGSKLDVVSRNYDDTITVRAADRPVQLGPAAAARIWIKLAGEAAPESRGIRAANERG